MRPYTDHTPKSLFPVAGRPLLDLIIEKLKEAGCRAVIINTHHLHRQVEDFVAAQNYGFDVRTRYEPEILGTGGAIKNVADFWDDQPFMVINADIVTDINLQTVYSAHCRYHPLATLVLCDNPTFNSVAVEQNKWITAFHPPADRTARSSDGLLTFTGIQVLEPQVLDYIPRNRFYSSIDAFKKILAEGKKLGAFIAPGDSWQDVGTPRNYRQTVVERMFPEAFQRAFATAPDGRIRWEKLKGDGSERQWYRVSAARRSMVMVDHGIRQTLTTSEADSFVNLGMHLYRQGVSVPKIYDCDTFSGLVFLEDLGDVNLQQTVQSTGDMTAVIGIYKSVIAEIIKLSGNGADKFNRNWTYQTPDYSRELIIEKECRYFLDAFLNGYLGWNERFENFQAEFFALADKALQHPTLGFMHRDMQSRNIMVRNHDIYFIDFQGGRIGPIQYDLASLLIDPYVQLPASTQKQLLDYSIGMLAAATGLEPEKFRSCYHYCALTRNLQILGAFAYLSRVKGKKQFENYIPAAVKSLQANLAARKPGEFPTLSAIVEKVCKHMQIA